jgi:L-alanine-DL-glutamate epimerase-like enolase superfamily enzyme
VENVLTGLIKVEKGYAAAPHGPGLGIELNEKALREFLTKGKSRVLVGKKG